MRLEDKIILLTGGTGSFGQAFVRYLLKHHPEIRQIRVFSRNEQSQMEMSTRIPSRNNPVQYWLGDVRDKERVLQACKSVDIVVHAAAIKSVPFAEQNPMECLKTNILGSNNIVEAAIERDVTTVVALSTDKAALPIGIYGASKLVLERLFVLANRPEEGLRTRFSVVRYGNIFGSRGSVVPLFLHRKATRQSLPVTDAEMTRFSITLQDSIDLVVFAIKNGVGGEIVLPNPPSYRILDVAKAVNSGTPTEIVGRRAGEKLHELLYSEFEAPRTVVNGRFFVILPEIEGFVEKYCSETNATIVANQSAFESGANTAWLTESDIESQIADLTNWPT